MALRGGVRAAPRGGLSPARFYDAVCGMRVELVLTAHPTEVTRRTLLQKFDRSPPRSVRDRTDLTPAERDELVEGLRREITAAWVTDEIRRQRPTPDRGGTCGTGGGGAELWNAVPRYLRTLDRSSGAHRRGLPPEVAPIRSARGWGATATAIPT